MQPFRLLTDGVLIDIRLTPRASEDAVTGIDLTADGRPHLAIRVRALPEKGAANAAATKLLADWLGLPKASVSIAAGATSRLKTLRVSGDVARLVAMLEAKLADPVQLSRKRR